ncbi:Cytochrome c553 [Alteromonadaceae bacterium Bs31]|nr:Cytochrome c553 [Alteromonadaceae bacterium Bs31]
MKLRLISFALVLCSPVVFAAGAPPKAALCNACHGANGAAPIAPNYPKLNGQNKEYLVASLKAYKVGDRKGGLAAVMVGQAKGLKDEEMEALAAYYAAQE